MEKVSESQAATLLYRPRLEKGIGLVDVCFDTLFEKAPVMMQTIDEYWRLVRVNRIWLQNLGYENQEVLGRRCVDFFTEQSRAWAVNDTFPLFWRTGSARSVGYEMVRKDGRVMNVLTDAELDIDEAGVRHGFTTIRGQNDLVWWSHSPTMLAALTGLMRVKRSMETLLALAAPQGGPAGPGERDCAAPGRDQVFDLMVRALEVCNTLNSLGSALADSAKSIHDQEQTLTELAETVVTFSGKIPWLTGAQPGTAR